MSGPALPPGLVEIPEPRQIWAALLAVPRPLVMGVLNVTPDSFADGGRFFDPDAALAQARALIIAGADILDIGGESTRPFADPVPLDEEL
ncbi:MAG TPA: dihydropteroate synthase, partial [Thermodesulfobacteriota bacterium]|nr:dihydropteroate synthase [Thermodesulfobacteriota bacterium]